MKLLLPKTARNQAGFSSFIILGVVVLAVLGFLAYTFLLPKQTTPTPSASTEKPKVIGVMQNIKNLDTVYDGYKAGLKELGYEDGKNIVLKYQIGDNQPVKLKAIADDFLNQKVDVIAAITEISLIHALREATAAGQLTPIVYGLGDNSIGLGTIKDYKSSGNQVTGVENLNSESFAKKFEFLRQIIPNGKKVGIFAAIPANSTPITIASYNEAKRQATKQGFEIVDFTLQSPPSPASTVEMQKLADTLQAGQVDAILALPDPVANYQQNYKIIVALGKRLKVPTIMQDVSTIQEGGLIAYNADFGGIGKQMAVMTDKILKGTKPASIPIEFPSKYILVINLKTAQEIGITFPNEILAIADRKIE